PHRRRRPAPVVLRERGDASRVAARRRGHCRYEKRGGLEGQQAPPRKPLNPLPEFGIISSHHRFSLLLFTLRQPPARLFATTAWISLINACLFSVSSRRTCIARAV